jgi:uncharacterized protein
VVEGWLERPQASILEPTERHLGILRALLADAGTAGSITTDAHLAALAIEHSATVSTFDADFRRFGGLKLEYLGSSEGG